MVTYCFLDNMVHFDTVINRVVENSIVFFPAMICGLQCLSMDLSDVHVSINMPRSYTVPISASEHLCGVEAFLHQFLLLSAVLYSIQRLKRLIIS